MNSEKLKELLHYDPETGVFIWKVNRGGKAQAGTIAGRTDGHGYRQICVCSTMYMAHRLAWLYVYGVLPKQQIDHINGIPDDNRIRNLREATQLENNQNNIKYSNNKSGYLGVCLYKQKWMAQIQTNGKKKYLGLFNSKEEAYAVYLKAKEALHEFQPVPREV